MDCTDDWDDKDSSAENDAKEEVPEEQPSAKGKVGRPKANGKTKAGGKDKAVKSKPDATDKKCFCASCKHPKASNSKFCRAIHMKAYDNMKYQSERDGEFHTLEQGCRTPAGAEQAIEDFIKNNIQSGRFRKGLIDWIQFKRQHGVRTAVTQRFRQVLMDRKAFFTHYESKRLHDMKMDRHHHRHTTATTHTITVTTTIDLHHYHQQQPIVFIHVLGSLPEVGRARHQGSVGQIVQRPQCGRRRLWH